MRVEDARQRRVTSLLASYYDDAGERARGREDAGERGGGRETGETRGHLDANDFDVDAFVADACGGGDGTTAHEAYARVARELRDAESRTQMLVYDNYGKFTRAASAAKSLRTASGEMRERCEELRERVVRARVLSERTHERLSARREVVEQLRGVRGLIGKLSSSLRAAPALEALAASADGGGEEGGDEARSVILEYVDAKDILDELGRDGSEARAFVRAKRRCDEAMNKIIARLKERARASALNDGVAHGSTFVFGLSDDACTELLSALRVSQDELVDDFLKSRKRNLGERLEAARAAFGDPLNEQKNNLKDFMSALDQAFLGEFTTVLEAFGKMFAKVEGSRGALVKFTKEVFADYFALVREIYAPNVDRTDMTSVSTSGSVSNPKQLMCAMGTMAADLASVHRSVPEAALGDRVMETVERAVRSRVGTAFACLEQALVNEINLAYETAKAVSAEAANRASAASAGDVASKSLLQRFIALSDTLLTSVQTLLSDVESLMDERPILISSWREEFAYMVRGHFAGLIHALVSRLIVGSPISPDPAPNPTPPRTPLAVAVTDATKILAATPPPPSFLLVCARMCAFLHTSATTHIAEALMKMFPASAASGGDFSLDESRAMCESASKVLLTWYVEQSAQRIGFMIRKSLTAVDWSKMREPREVRPLADYISDSLRIIESECEQVLDVGEIDADAASAGSVADGVFTPIRSTQSSVMCAVIKRALKSYVECVRCQTFPTKFAYQQVTVDIQYLTDKVLLRFMPSGQFETDVYEKQSIETILNELRVAAMQRALDPSPMDKAVVERIIQKSSVT